MVILRSVNIRFQKCCIFLVVTLFTGVLFSVVQPVRAAELDTRSVQITSAIPSATTSQVFSFNVPSTSTVGSIEFEYCSNSPFIGTACTVPAGMNAAGAALVGQTNNVGFTLDLINTTSNRIVLTRPASSSITGMSSYTFDTVVNSSTANQTIYVRIALFGSVDATGPRGDNGAVAFAITGAFRVGAYVPPYLIFCAAITVALDCSTTNGLLINFGELSKIETKTATSQFSGATNDPTGYSVAISGQTMTAGNQIIPPLSVVTPSAIGVSQFGINLRSNTVPSVGAEPSGAGTAAVNGSYAVPNQYKFANGEQLVSSPISTDYNLHTVSYIVNIETGQQPGYYATTLTYIATAAF